jgi:ApbE superfamily uncharacterized protein (UPF0280 family)
MTLAHPGRDDRKLEVIDPQTVLVEYGPMRMSIQALDHGRPLIDLSMEGGQMAFRVLEDLARFFPVLKRKALEIEVEAAFPEVVRKMIEACQRMKAQDLTPLAAVAGASSDIVADFMIGKGGTKVIVDNGGDVAIRLKEEEEARIGIKTEVDAKRPSYLLVIESRMGVGGIATSGLGGRSFTKGIASAVTILSEDASLADAAATVIGNATNVEDPAIKRCLPETVYPDTDIPGEWVTESVGDLSSQKIEEALQEGLTEAYRIYRESHIKGAFITVKGNVAWTDSIHPWLRKL